jgi:hypothetical protein
MTHRNRVAPLALTIALALGAPTLALAEDSEGETPPEEQELANKYADIPFAVKNFIAILQDLDNRYPDSGKVDMDRLIAEEGETIGLAYCAAVGVDGPCMPSKDRQGNDVFVPVSANTAARSTSTSRWFNWLLSHTINVGVIPETNACPANISSWTKIYMDDENRRNANNRWGWIGATISNANTTYHFCKLDALRSLEYRPLRQSGDAYDYAVVNMGILCPSGGRRYIRVQENELWNNGNHTAGGVFPNVQVYNTTFNFYCHFDGGSSSILGHMGGFPDFKFAYGVFAAHDMPSTYALAKGRVEQDDEDWWNWNAWWFGTGDHVMWGDRNTSRSLAKVR